MKIKMWGCEFPVKTFEFEDGGETLGRWNGPQGRIEISHTCPPNVYLCTLMHEVLEGLLDRMDLSDLPHHVITLIAEGYTQVLKDNPELVKKFLE